jgi:hypothetical protein
MRLAVVLLRRSRPPSPVFDHASYCRSSSPPMCSSHHLILLRRHSAVYIYPFCSLFFRAHCFVVSSCSLISLFAFLQLLIMLHHSAVLVF